MPADYSQRVFYGKVFFPDIAPNDFLRINDNHEVVGSSSPLLSYEIFTQSTPSSTWEFQHNLGTLPTVVVRDPQGQDITASVNVYVDTAIVRVSTDGNLIYGTVEIHAFPFTNNSIPPAPTNGLAWLVVSEDTNLQSNTGYTVTGNGRVRVNLVLPESPSLGSRIVVTGEESWRIVQNNGDIRMGSQLCGATVYLDSTDVGDSVELYCGRIGNNGNHWFVISSCGNLNLSGLNAFLIGTDGSAAPTVQSQSGMPWLVLSADDQLQSNHGYTITGSNLRINIKLPLLPSLGDRIIVVGEAPWRIIPNGGIIRMGTILTTANTGYLESTSIGDSVELFCTRTDGTHSCWSVNGSTGNFTLA